MDLTSFFIQLVGGVAGGVAAASAVVRFSLGTLGNGLAGLVGGPIGAQMAMSAMGVAHPTTLDFGENVVAFAAAVLGGGIMTLAMAALVKPLTR